MSASPGDHHQNSGWPVPLLSESRSPASGAELPTLYSRGGLPVIPHPERAAAPDPPNVFEVRRALHDDDWPWTLEGSVVVARSLLKTHDRLALDNAQLIAALRGCLDWMKAVDRFAQPGADDSIGFAIELDIQRDQATPTATAVLASIRPAVFTDGDET